MTILPDEYDGQLRSSRLRVVTATVVRFRGGKPMSDATTYLLVVYQAAQTDSEPISPGRVAAELDRSPAATTEMLQRLDSRGLVTYEPYAGATLTDEGRQTATELQDTYLVLHQFFSEVLELADPETEARQLAGSLSPVVAERLAAMVLDVDKSETTESHLSVFSHSES